MTSAPNPLELRRDRPSAPTTPRIARSGPDWFGAFTNVRREHGFERLRVEGALPTALRGTFYRNGPGLVAKFGRRYRHWFDGDGLVSAVRYRDGAALGAVRLLQTEGLLEEERRKRMIYGAFGTAPRWSPGRALGILKGGFKDPANTSLVRFDERLLALCEVGRPFELDPEDLRSIGETDLDGVIPKAFGAHPHRVAANGYIYGMGTRIGMVDAVDLFALRPNGTAGRIATIPLDFPTMIHDFAATERHLVIFVAPLRSKVVPMLLAGRSFTDSLTWEPDRGTEVIVVPLDAPSSPIRFHVDPFWTWHIANAFSCGRELVVDFVRYADYPSSARWLEGVARGRRLGRTGGVLSRAFISPVRQTMRHVRITEPAAEFPRVAPHVQGARHTVLYCAEHPNAEAENVPPTALVRIDTETGRTQRYVFPDGHYPSEAVFAPRGAAEDDGWLHTQVYDASTHTSYFAVLDATRLADGPVATAHLDHHVPLGFHGLWWPDA